MTTSRDYKEYVRETDEWRAAIGKAILGFGEIELITYQCLVHLPKEKIEAITSRQGFAFRVDLIVEILESWNQKSELVAPFIGMLKRARTLAQTRNDIAHNPVMLNVFQSKVSDDLSLEHCISTVRGGRLIDLADAKKFADEVESLAAEMWLQMGELRTLKMSCHAVHNSPYPYRSPLGGSSEANPAAHSQKAGCRRPAKVGPWMAGRRSDNRAVA